MQDKYKIELSIKAKNDLKSIVRYIKNELQEPSIAKKYAELIKKELKNLEHLPQKYAVIDEKSIKDLNSLLFLKSSIKSYIFWSS